MKRSGIYIRSCVIFMLILFIAQSALAYVPVRISIKFILDASGNRPTTGNLNTDAEINSEVDWGNTILRDNFSEFRLEELELIDLSGVSQWYNTTAGGNQGPTNRDNLRAAAIADPTTYHWRTDAINIYINGGPSSAISKFPPDNDIILMNQWCANTPSCVLHELGHSLNLMHTHEPCCTNQDLCADTVSDNQNWTKDQLAQNNFGDIYANLTAAQQDQVDLVFNNVMSYHVSEPQLRLSTCQMGRESTQGDSDRTWLLSRIPVYVNNGYGGSSQTGRYVTPYKTFQAAVNAGLSARVLVVQQGSYTSSTPITANTTIVTRSGPSTIHNGAFLYSLPTDLENSKSPEVSNAMKAVRSEDNAARKVMNTARQSAKMAATTQEKTTVMANAEVLKKQHQGNAITHLLHGEGFAAGQEKVAIRLELGQRYRDAGNCAEAIRFFDLVAKTTQQIHLKERVLLEIKQCQAKLDQSLQGTVPQEEEVTPGN